MKFTTNFELFREAVAVVDGIPESKFTMSVLNAERLPGTMLPTGVSGADFKPAGCYSVGCAVGWLSAHPRFQALGLVYRSEGMFVDPDYLKYKLRYQDAAGRLFNMDPAMAYWLFRPTLVGMVSNKRVFMSRVHEFLLACKQPVSQEFADKYPVLKVEPVCPYVC